jgi:hypothetical protein
MCRHVARRADSWAERGQVSKPWKRAGRSTGIQAGRQAGGRYVYGRLAATQAASIESEIQGGFPSNQADADMTRQVHIQTSRHTGRVQLSEGR